MNSSRSFCRSLSEKSPSALNTLRATGRFQMRCMARYTVANPPSPTTLSTAYFSAIVRPTSFSVSPCAKKRPPIGSPASGTPTGVEGTPEEIRAAAGSGLGPPGRSGRGRQAGAGRPLVSAASLRPFASVEKGFATPLDSATPSARGSAALSDRPPARRAIRKGSAQVAQSVEQGTENPRVGGSIPPLRTESRGKRRSAASPATTGRQ